MQPSSEGAGEREGQVGSTGCGVGFCLSGCSGHCEVDSSLLRSPSLSCPQFWAVQVAMSHVERTWSLSSKPTPHLFSKYLDNMHYASGTMQGAEDTVIKKIVWSLLQQNLQFCGEDTNQVIPKLNYCRLRYMVWREERECCNRNGGGWGRSTLHARAGLPQEVAFKLSTEG